MEFGAGGGGLAAVPQHLASPRSTPVPPLARAGVGDAPAMRPLPLRIRRVWYYANYVRLK